MTGLASVRAVFNIHYIKNEEEMEKKEFGGEAWGRLRRYVGCDLARCWPIISVICF